ncbi:MAG TPA: site-specific DNA-methyltransferase [Polyangiaceae bacterium]|nr:site-specific DNA-methyltransferase [Polyangiaceae bacterium]
MRRDDAPRLAWNSRGSQAAPQPAQLSPVTDPSAAARLIQGDNLGVLTCLAADSSLQGQVALAYLDPPFLTGREHFHVERSKDGGARPRTRTAAFDDRFANLAAYLDVLEPRLRAVRELLMPGGSLVLHVDPKTSHYAKIICDELFGLDAFQSEIIWRYRRWPSKTKNFQRVHDVLLRYVKEPSAEPRWNQLYEPLAASTLATWGNSKQRAVTNDSGRRTRSSKTEEVSLGTPLGDVWEIGIVAPVARERTGYPTQKPEALLGRLIESLTLEGDLVLDPYVGSGTTLVSALTRGRRAIGIDQSQTALDVVRERLRARELNFVEQTLQPRLRRGAVEPRRAASSEASRAAEARGLSAAVRAG